MLEMLGPEHAQVPDPGEGSDVFLKALLVMQLVAAQTQRLQRRHVCAVVQVGHNRHAVSAATLKKKKKYTHMRKTHLEG